MVQGSLPADQGRRPGIHDGSEGIERIAVGVDGRATGRDAACLAMTIAGATRAEVMLVTVVVEPPIPRQPNKDRTAMHERAATTLRELSFFMAPGSRRLVETDRSVVRGLERVSRRERPDLIVVGSSSGAPEGRVRIGRHTRHLLAHRDCALAVAPRNLCATGMPPLATIGVGYDGTPEAREALRLAGSLARAAGARLRVRAVVDDRLPWYPWAPVGRAKRQAMRGEVQEMWDELIEPQLESLREDTERAAAATGADVTVDVRSGSPPADLLALSQEVDVLLIGSRHWGAADRALLGRTGEELLHQASCSVVVVPRPPSPSAARSDASQPPSVDA